MKFTVLVDIDVGCVFAEAGDFGGRVGVPAGGGESETGEIMCAIMLTFGGG
jgi:hypothetical protein